MDVHSLAPATARQGRALAVFLLVAGVLFGGWTVYKSTRMKQGDAHVFFRAAWAVRQGGASLYEVTDHHGWHYHYPPLFAILIAPLADPPPSAAAGSYLPDWASLAVLYLINLASLAGGLHLLAGAIEAHLPAAPDAGVARRRWWLLRLGPALLTLPAVGLTLVRGQVNFLLLLLLCGFLAGLLRGRRFSAGLFLAGAICLKIIPAFLLLVPLCRRDGRCLLGCAMGLFAGLIAVPALALGPATTARLYATQAEVLLKPALGSGPDQSRATELIDATATHSQSFQTVLHKTLHLGAAVVPPRPSPAVRLLHWLLGGLMTAWTLWLGRRGFRDNGLSLAALTGALVVAMLLVSPVCHLHYFVLLAPLLMLVLAWCSSQATRGQQALAGAVLALGVVAAVLAQVPPVDRVATAVGLQMLAALAVWGLGLRLEWPAPADVTDSRQRAA
jgi:hypothetical protein